MPNVIYCLAYTDHAGQGVDRWDLASQRDKAAPSYKEAMPFEVEVAYGAGDDEIEDAIDAYLTQNQKRETVSERQPG